MLTKNEIKWIVEICYKLLGVFNIINICNNLFMSFKNKLKVRLAFWKTIKNKSDCFLCSWIMLGSELYLLSKWFRLWSDISLPTNISIVVFWSRIPILQDERTVASNCRCKEVTFSCHIAIEDSIQGNFGVSSKSKSIS